MSSNSSTPASITPQSTGTQDTSLSASASPYKKPQVAFYPHVNSSNKPQKPFSRSAAKRESVMALGSIEHLQHYFTKTGIAAKKECVSCSVDRICQLIIFVVVFGTGPRNRGKASSQHSGEFMVTSVATRLLPAWICLRLLQFLPPRPFRRYPTCASLKPIPRTLDRV